MEAELTTSLASLAPWSGDVAELTELVKTENAIIDRLTSDIVEAEREFDRAKAQTDQRELARDQAKAKLDAIGAATVVSIEEAAQIRAQRELDWSQHRAALTEETADRFEKAMRLDDQVTSTLGQQRAQAEKATGAGNELVEAERLLDSAMKQMATATSNCSMLSEKLATIISSVSDTLPAEMKLPAFRAWLDRLDAAHKVLEQRNRAVRELNRHQLVFDRAKTDLLAALAHVGLQIPEQPSFALMLETAQSLLDRATQIEALREAEAQARENVVRRKSALQTELNAIERWQADWDATCADTWMAGTAFGASEMRAILEELDRLREQHREVTDLSHRIETMQANREKFEQSV